MLCVPSIHHNYLRSRTPYSYKMTPKQQKNMKPNQHHCSLIFFLLFNFSWANCNATPTSKYTEMNLKWYKFRIFVEIRHSICHSNSPRILTANLGVWKAMSLPWQIPRPSQLPLRPPTSCILKRMRRRDGMRGCGIFGDFFFQKKNTNSSGLFWPNFPEDFTFSDPIPSF